ncbi:RNA polymerase sigma factor SigJ [Brevibacterium picturae]|uniref:RNA polymerase sigma-70 factor n=1 Tax=Brevibacterium picturae TaxID=260553 RepID=A0ABP4MW00_9MICO
MNEIPPGHTSGEDATDVFVGYRQLLYSIAYNMLGNVADVEDVLQDVWLAWTANAKNRSEPVANPRAYLVRMAINQALSRRAAISRRREVYVGQWLPEPIVADAPLSTAPVESADAVGHEDLFSMALLVVLESLSPAERAVFVLHEAFGFSHPEIAEILGRNPTAVRQLAHRARSHVQARRPRYHSDPRVREEVTERFVSAALGGDLKALMDVLSPDVTLWTDGGGKGPAVSLQPVYGRRRVADVFLRVAANNHENLGIRSRAVNVNGDHSALVYSEGSPLAIVVVEVTESDELVREIYSVTNPDKLSRIR